MRILKLILLLILILGPQFIPVPWWYITSGLALVAYWGCLWREYRAGKEHHRQMADWHK